MYRAIEVLAIGVSQLGIDQWRGDRRTPPVSIISKPCTAMHRPAFLEHAVVSLALDGNAYWRILRDPKGIPVDLIPLNPTEVSPAANRDTGKITYHWRGLTLTPGDRHAGDVVQLQKLRIPGREKGLGPIESARAELTGAMQARDYAATWFQDGDVPSGILATDQVITSEQAQQTKMLWSGWNPETEKYEPVGHGVR